MFLSLLFMYEMKILNYFFDQPKLKLKCLVMITKISISDLRLLIQFNLIVEKI